MKILAVFLLACACALGYEVPVDCTQIFEARKDEILKEIERLDEQRQALESFRASTNAAYEQGLDKLAKKEADVNATMRQIEAKRQEVAELLAQNEKILKELKTMTTDKVSASYAKMKDQAAADVLSSDATAIQTATIRHGTNRSRKHAKSAAHSCRNIVIEQAAAFSIAAARHVPHASAVP